MIIECPPLEEKYFIRPYVEVLLILTTSAGCNIYTRTSIRDDTIKENGLKAI